ncbi:uncharacterized protein LOC125490131 [Plutella xylostella]|uniref:uncharacterized protein LOC125490131 n=1 Tax=Plutella xylostella TaxID=51655 RepID=UPI0020324422|nr:uncharacterized protein LOC125490131 [Plutella xylostella]
MQTTGTSSEFCQGVLENPGMACKSKEVLIDSLNRDRISWNNLEHKGKLEAPVRDEGYAPEAMHFEDSEEKSVELARLKGHTGQAKLRRLCGPYGTPSLQALTKNFQSAPPEIATLQFSAAENSKGGTDMVVDQCTQRITDPLERRLDVCDHRCSRRRLGCNCEWPATARQMDHKTEEVAQQSVGIVGSIRSSSTFGTRATRENNNVTVGQSNNGGIPQQTGRYKIKAAAHDSHQNSSAMRKDAVPCNCQAHTGIVQWNSRRFIEGKESPGMASQQTSVKMDFQQVWNSRDRSVRVAEISGCTEVCKREYYRHEEPVHRRVQQEMALQTRLDLPTASTDTESATSLTVVKGPLHSGRPHFGTGFLGPRTQQNNGETASPDPRSSQEHGGPTNESATPGSKRFEIRGLASSGWASQCKSWSEDDLRVLESSWRKSTLKTYTPAWKRWHAWATSNHVPTNDPSAENLAKYLLHLRKDIKMAPKTIALHKSVVAKFANPLKCQELSSHVLVKQVLRGIFNSDPPVKRSLSWKIEDLLAFLKTYPLDEDNLFALSRHVAVLLLLASGRRVHDLTLLSIKDGMFEDNVIEMVFWPKFGSKTDSCSYRQSGWKLHKGLDTEPRLDLMNFIRKIISISKHRRDARNPDGLFITTRGSVRNASRTVIAGWIKTLFKEAGISASAGSFRAAVATHNWTSNRYSIEEIPQRGNWRSQNTFFRHYFKEIKALPGSNANTLIHCFSSI